MSICMSCGTTHDCRGAKRLIGELAETREKLALAVKAIRDCRSRCVPMGYDSGDSGVVDVCDKTLSAIQSPAFGRMVEARGVVILRARTSHDKFIADAIAAYDAALRDLSSPAKTGQEKP